MFEIYIVQVVVADGWGEDYFYCYHNIDNAREKIAEIAAENDMVVYNPDFAVRHDPADHEHRVAEVKLSEEMFED